MKSSRDATTALLGLILLVLVGINVISCPGSLLGSTSYLLYATAHRVVWRLSQDGSKGRLNTHPPEDAPDHIDHLPLKKI